MMYYVVVVLCLLLIVERSVQQGADAPTPAPSTSTTCLYGNDMVSTRSGERMVKNLKRNDHVLSVSPNGSLVYSPVFMQMHKTNQEVSNAVEIHTHSGRTIRLTPEHVIFVSKRCMTPLFSRALSVLASTVEVGDCVFGLVGANSFKNEAIPPISNHIDAPLPESKTVRIERVSHIQTRYVQGVYNPVVHEGTLVVNGIVVSCYAYLPNHRLLHNVFSMLYYLPGNASKEMETIFQRMSPEELAKWMMSLASRLQVDTDGGICFKKHSLKQKSLDFHL